MSKYPFYLGATSLTKPMNPALDNIHLNLEMGMTTTEVTLEYPRELPVSQELKDGMKRFQSEKGVDFTIHLPLSLKMTDVNPLMRDASLQTLEQIFNEMEELNPKAYVLHVTPFFKTGGTPLGRPFEVQLHEERMEAAYDSLSRLTNLIEPRKIAVENLFHNLTFHEELVKEFDYSVCMDVGHLILNQADPYLFYHKHRDRIKVIHLHDVVNGRDHQQLGEPGSKLDLAALFQLFKKYQYQETIILEQFKVEHLQQSQEAIARVWEQI